MKTLCVLQSVLKVAFAMMARYSIAMATVLIVLNVQVNILVYASYIAMCIFQCIDFCLQLLYVKRAWFTRSVVHYVHQHVMTLKDHRAVIDLSVKGDASVLMVLC